jgi:type II secretory pathway component PulF
MFEKMRNEVLNGGSMGPTMADSPFMPASAGQMVLTAERTGTMGSVLQLMGEFYEDEGETRLRELATILEPLIIIVMGTVVAFVVMSLMLPLFSFASIGEGHK